MSFAANGRSAAPFQEYYAGEESDETSTYDHAPPLALKEDWVDREERQRRVGQLLLLGSTLAITGLLLSLVMLIFNVECSDEYKIGSYVNRTGSFEMCREMYRRREIEPDVMGLDESIVVNVPAVVCREDQDCQGIEKGFCGGGDGELRVPGYCEANHCTCKSTLPDCGLKTYYLWPYKASDFIPNCRSAVCAQNRTQKIPLWMFENGFGGCHYRRKTTLSDVQLLIQRVLERDHILGPVVPSDPFQIQGARMWEHMQETLATTPDVKFLSFWPSTISESVSDGFSPEGRIFFGFMLCASLCLLSSDYTHECVTVDLPNKKVPLFRLQWNTLRSWLPPIGLILLSTVQMVPNSKITNFPSALMTAVHLFGAQLCFLVYLVCEAVALHDDGNVEEMDLGREWQLRVALSVLGVTSMATFGLVYFMLAVFSGTERTPYVLIPSFGFSDVYKQSFTLNQIVLLRSAEGFWRVLKYVSYFAEYLVALAILVSHLVIWYYFEWHRRRRVDAKKHAHLFHQHGVDARFGDKFGNGSRRLLQLGYAPAEHQQFRYAQEESSHPAYWHDDYPQPSGYPHTESPHAGYQQAVYPQHPGYLHAENQHSWDAQAAEYPTYAHVGQPVRVHPHEDYLPGYVNAHADSPMQGYPAYLNVHADSPQHPGYLQATGYPQAEYPPANYPHGNYL